MTDIRGYKCSVCAHALSSHNDLGYCQVRSKRDGECCCDTGAGSAYPNRAKAVAKLTADDILPGRDRDLFIRTAEKRRAEQEEQHG